MAWGKNLVYIISLPINSQTVNCFAIRSSVIFCLVPVKTYFRQTCDQFILSILNRACFVLVYR